MGITYSACSQRNHRSHELSKTDVHVDGEEMISETFQAYPIKNKTEGVINAECHINSLINKYY
jgi:hypothetical protein